MKFQYSPGLLGYGAKGGDGSAGLQGLALYFTDFDPVFDLLRIEDCIRNDYVMWSSTPGVKLPGERVYQSGDLFVSSRGYIYQIDASEDEFTDTGAALSKSEFFEPHFPPIYDTIMGFERYSNIHSASTNYLIDNNFSSKSSYLVPGNIYGINLENFTRIEFTDVSAFTLYSCAEQADIDEHKALAIFKDNDGFRIGNLENGNLRDTNLTLDVSLLLVNRQDSNRIKSNTPSGTLITNAEKATNILFDPIFKDQPADPDFGIKLEPLGEYARLRWDLSHFTPGYYDPSIKGTIVFNKNQESSGTWAINASIFKPLIIHDVDPSGYIIINDLSIGTYYEYYMILKKDGWERQSVKNRTLETGSPATMDILDPISKTLNANYLGEFIPYEPYGGNLIYGVDISTDSFTGWNANRGSYTWIEPSGNWYGEDPSTYTFDVLVSKNTGVSPRTGTINIYSEAPLQTITVNQGVLQTWVDFNYNGNIVFTPPLTDQYVYLNIKVYAWVKVERDYALGSRTVRAQIDLKEGATIRSSAYLSRKATNEKIDASTFTSYNAYITPGNYNNWDLTETLLECDWDNNKDYEGSMIFAELVSVSKVSGTGRIDISTNKKFWYATKFYPYCVHTQGASSTVPSMPPWY